MLSGLKVPKKYMHVMGSTSRAGICVACLKLITLGRRIVNRLYTVLKKYAHTGLNQSLLRSTTLDIITKLLDNAAFVCANVVERFSNDFSEVRGLRSRGFQLSVEWMTTVVCTEL